MIKRETGIWRRVVASASLLIVAIVLAAPRPAAAASCAALKLKAIAKLEAEGLGCLVKLQATLDTVAFQACNAKAVAKLDKIFVKAGPARPRGEIA